MKKLLLHTCCSCCASYVVELLKKDYDVVLFFSNSNIFPLEEYINRLESTKKLAEKSGVKLLIDEYAHEDWLSAVKNVKDYDKLPEHAARCPVCYEFRLERTADFAEKNGFDVFTTTFTISPHQNAERVNESGRMLEKKYGVKFLEANFKKKDGFKHTVELSKKYDLYRQTYCGCEFSIRK